MDHDIALLIRDKYDGDATQVTEEDRTRLASGEPLAYVIGWVPFLGLRIDLDSHPLIPRPETEWWSEELIKHLNERFNDTPFTLLDLCAGSGAIGLAVLKHCPLAQVSFGELSPKHTQLIEKTIEQNNLDRHRATVRSGDLFAPFTHERFDIIATNPPYIPDGRELDPSVLHFEPKEALISGSDGLDLIRRIAKEVSNHLNPTGELWLEADISNIQEAAKLLKEGGAVSTTIRTDLYGRERIVLAYY